MTTSLDIDATWMRGGTSKCWVFRAEDLAVPGLSVDEVLRRVYGSPDQRQVDGVGGGTSTTSKAVILSPTATDDVEADVDYTFAQVGVDDGVVDWGSNCGNCSAVVAPYAVRAGWVDVDGPETTVRVRNTNTGQIIVQQVPTPGGELDESPTAQIPGVPFPGAPVRMGFVDPAGRSTGRLFPSGKSRDVLTVPADGDDEPLRVEVTLVDAGAPVVAVPAREVGLVGDEAPAAIDARPGLLALLDRVRRAGAVAMGMVAEPADAERAVPKLALVSAAATGSGADLGVRMLSMGRVHPAVPITGSVALTLAARTPGTVVADLVDDQAGAVALRLGTPAGVVETFVDQVDDLQVVGAVRTYRRLASGSVALPLADPAA